MCFVVVVFRTEEEGEEVLLSSSAVAAAAAAAAVGTTALFSFIVAKVRRHELMIPAPSPVVVQRENG